MLKIILFCSTAIVIFNALDSSPCIVIQIMFMHLFDWNISVNTENETRMCHHKNHKCYVALNMLALILLYLSTHGGSIANTLT